MSCFVGHACRNEGCGLMKASHESVSGKEDGDTQGSSAHVADIKIGTGAPLKCNIQMGNERKRGECLTSLLTTPINV